MAGRLWSVKPCLPEDTQCIQRAPRLCATLCPLLCLLWPCCASCCAPCCINAAPHAVPAACHRGVIIGWDPMCAVGEQWMQQMGVDRLPGGANRAGQGQASSLWCLLACCGSFGLLRVKEWQNKCTLPCMPPSFLVLALIHCFPVILSLSALALQAAATSHSTTFCLTLPTAQARHRPMWLRKTCSWRRCRRWKPATQARMPLSFSVCSSAVWPRCLLASQAQHRHT